MLTTDRAVLVAFVLLQFPVFLLTAQVQAPIVSGALEKQEAGKGARGLVSRWQWGGLGQSWAGFPLTRGEDEIL